MPSSWRCKICNSRFALWSHLTYSSNFLAHKFNFRQPCQNNSAPSQVLLFASPGTFRKVCGEAILWQHQSDCAHLQRIQSIRSGSEKFRKMLHCTDVSRQWIFKKAELLYIRRAALYKHWHQIHEFGSTTAACEILHGVTIDAKKGRNRALLLHYLVPAICALQGATPIPISPHQAKY